jgi:glutamate-5-semialdehyde dehydrogenase
MKKNNYLDQLGKKSLIASSSIVNLTEKQKNKALNDYILEIRKNKKNILKANALDIKKAKSKNIKDNIIERSILNNDRIESKKLLNLKILQKKSLVLGRDLTV